MLRFYEKHNLDSKSFQVHIKIYSVLSSAVVIVLVVLGVSMELRRVVSK
jgi:hypothetical protein